MLQVSFLCKIQINNRTKPFIILDQFAEGISSATIFAKDVCWKPDVNLFTMLIFSQAKHSRHVQWLFVQSSKWTIFQVVLQLYGWPYSACAVYSFKLSLHAALMYFWAFLTAFLRIFSIHLRFWTTKQNCTGCLWSRFILSECTRLC